MKTNELKACPLEEQPTTNCSRLEQAFRVKKVNEKYLPECWVVRKDNERMIIGFIKEQGFKPINTAAFVLSPSELRELADLVETTLKGQS